MRIKENNELSEDEKYEYIEDVSRYGDNFFLLSLYFLDLDFKESMKYYGFTDLERFFDFFCKLMPRCMDEICYFHDAQFDYILFSKGLSIPIFNVFNGKRYLKEISKFKLADLEINALSWKELDDFDKNKIVNSLNSSLGSNGVILSLIHI